MRQPDGQCRSAIRRLGDPVDWRIGEKSLPTDDSPASNCLRGFSKRNSFGGHGLIEADLG